MNNLPFKSTSLIIVVFKAIWYIRKVKLSGEIEINEISVFFIKIQLFNEWIIHLLNPQAWLLKRLKLYGTSGKLNNLEK